ncbi:hypothetical protein [Pseudomonas syringae]|uniref:hypothetical protein n=1 Tax=Pseudomonas syringae TaxID=317 RepID=UPI000BB630B2|nr:hypothetical protein [Pseudomonas syringae]PBP70535.1 hypothetical protein CCL15_13370 [Pseudomonas syringae]UZS69626.1 hypothetical protein OQB65_09935 [Pseudomonas syringae]
MSILNIIFACISSLVYFSIFYQFRELAKTYDWAYNVGVPCLVAATLLLNYIKDKISERDPSSKLHKANTELKTLKATYDANYKENKKTHTKEIEESKARYETMISNLEKSIETLQGKLSVKDTMIHSIRTGITTNLLKHGDNKEFFLYARDLANKINSDLDMNTLAPVLTPETMKYIDMLK